MILKEHLKREQDKEKFARDQTMDFLKRTFGLAQSTAKTAEKPKLGQPLSEGPMKPQMTVHDYPGLSTEAVPDYWITESMYRVGRMVTDNFDNLGKYVANLTQEFSDVKRCSVYLAPSDTFADHDMKLEHRLTVARENGRVSIDETGNMPAREDLESLLWVLVHKTPMILDHNPGPGFKHGIKLVFGDLDRNSSSGHVHKFDKDEQKGMVSIMPFYYRESDNLSGVAIFEGDLRGKNSAIEGFGKAYWGAKLTMNAAAQISSQLTHRFDAITNLPRRIDFEVDLRDGIRDMIKEDTQGLYLMFVDLDNFKRINDVYTHPIGDEILKQVADRLQNSVRSNDTVFRLGGEEFAAILSGVSHAEALHIAERVRMNVEGIKVFVKKDSEGAVEIIEDDKDLSGAEPVSVTCSIGVTDVKHAAGNRIGKDLPPNGSGDRIIQDIFSTAYSRSAELLHHAKNNGKNCIYFTEKDGKAIRAATQLTI